MKGYFWSILYYFIMTTNLDIIIPYSTLSIEVIWVQVRVLSATSSKKKKMATFITLMGKNRFLTIIIELKAHH